MVRLKPRIPPSCPTNSTFRDLADTHKTGDLNLEEFCVAMYFIEGLLNGWFTKLPSVGKVPEHILQQAKHPIVIPGEIVKMSSSSKYKPEPKVNRPRKGDGGKQGQSRSGSGGDSSASDPEMVKEAPGTQSDERWGVSAPIQCNSDAVFSPLDPHGTGEVDGFTFAKYMEAHSKLPQSDVATIWYVFDPALACFTPSCFSVSFFKSLHGDSATTNVYHTGIFPISPVKACWTPMNLDWHFS